MARKEWRPFPEARAFARSLRLLGQFEWFAYARGDLRRLRGLRPEDIPFNPSREYRGEGWAGIRDWLGPPPLAPAVPGHLDFKRARRFARSLGLRSSVEWGRWCAGRVRDRPERPGNVPEDPAAIYPDAWRGWDDWLGAKRGAPHRPRHLPFEEARAFARGLGLADVREWRAFCRGERPDLGTRPEGVPACPDNVYCHRGWNGYGDWLGTGQISNREAPHVPFEEAREFALRLGLRGEPEWREWSRGERPDLPPRPDPIPTNPHRTYAGRGWKGWGDFLGTGNLHRGDWVFRSFEQSRAFAGGLSLLGVKDWRAFCHGERADLGVKPEDVPANPETVYRSQGWKDWGDFLGTGYVHPSRRTHRSFIKARRFARSLDLKGVAEWRDYVKGLRPELPGLPDDIPSGVESYYRGKGWKGWPDFLGNTGPRRKHLPFRSARAFARRLGLKTCHEWWDWLRGERPDLPPAPEDLPHSPWTVYADRGWDGWGDFLGTGNLSKMGRAFRSFSEARKFARALEVHTSIEWRVWSRGDRPDLPPRPPDIPGAPQMFYADEGWRGWPDFLGVERRRRAKTRHGAGSGSGRGE